MATKDSEGQVLQDGDSVVTIKTLEVKGHNIVLQRGTLLQNIRTLNQAGEIEVKVENAPIVLRSEFLRKA